MSEFLPRSSSVHGIPPVAGTDKKAGHRDLEVVVERDGYEDLEVSMMFDDTGSETVDPTVAMEFCTYEDPDTLHRLQVGDVIKVRVVINT